MRISESLRNFAADLRKIASALPEAPVREELDPIMVRDFLTFYGGISKRASLWKLAGGEVLLGQPNRSAADAGSAGAGMRMASLHDVDGQPNKIAAPAGSTKARIIPARLQKRGAREMSDALDKNVSDSYLVACEGEANLGPFRKGNGGGWNGLAMPNKSSAEAGSTKARIIPATLKTRGTKR